MQIHINELIMYKGDDNLRYGVTAAYNNHLSGNATTSEGNAILVRWIAEEKKYLVVDGYHRIVKGLLEGKEIYRCKMDWFGKKSFWLPPSDQRYNIKGKPKDKWLSVFIDE